MLKFHFADTKARIMLGDIFYYKTMEQYTLNGLRHWRAIVSDECIVKSIGTRYLTAQCAWSKSRFENEKLYETKEAVIMTIEEEKKAVRKILNEEQIKQIGEILNIVL